MDLEGKYVEVGFDYVCQIPPPEGSRAAPADVDGAAETLRRLADAGAHIVVRTANNTIQNDRLVEGWFDFHDIPLAGVNVPPVWADVIVDHRAVGAPLKRDYRIADEPFVNWNAVALVLFDPPRKDRIGKNKTLK